MNKRKGVIVVLGCLLAGMLYLTSRGASDIWNGWQSGHWPQATGKITKSVVTTRETQTETRRVGRENQTPSERTQVHSQSVFVPEIRYQYEVAGQTYDGTRITISDGVDFTDSTEADRVAKRYAVNSTVAVYHHPQAVSLSLLEPGVSSGAVAETAIGLGFSLFFGGLIAFLVSSRGREVFEALVTSDPEPQESGTGSSRQPRNRKRRD